MAQIGIRLQHKLDISKTKQTYTFGLLKAWSGTDESHSANQPEIEIAA